MSNMWRSLNNSFSVRNTILLLIYSGFLLLTLIFISLNDDLRQQNNELLQEISELRARLSACETRIFEPSLNYEKSRRRVTANVQYFWEYFQNAVDKLKKGAPNAINDIVILEKTVREYKITWMSDLERLSRSDGYDEWRQYEALQLKNLIKQKFEILQNPTDCNKTKIFKCYAYPEIGWGGITHEIAKCLTIAYSLNRTMVFNATNLQYTKGAGFAGILKPFSNNCKTTTDDEEVKWSGANDLKRIIYLDIDSRDTANYVVRRIPSEWAARLEKLTADPLAWWYGQILDNSLKYSSQITKLFQDSINELGFRKPIVGVHVRRTDKLEHFKLYQIDEYMNQVDEYYDQLELTQKVDKRRIYLATEEPQVIVEAKKKYVNYEILSNIEAAKIAAKLKDRWSLKSLTGIIVDLYMLSMCDFAVCTFSSNICLLLLEYYQVRSPDSIQKVISLDRLYHTDYKNFRFVRAIQGHNPIQNKEISLKVGDKIKINVHYYSHGMYFGKNIRTEQTGFFPAYKVELTIDTFDAPRIH